MKIRAKVRKKERLTNIFLDFIEASSLLQMIFMQKTREVHVAEQDQFSKPLDIMTGMSLCLFVFALM